MLKGLFIARQFEGFVWQRDFESSDFWKPEEFGISINVHADYKTMLKGKNITNKYDFFLVEEIRSKSYQKLLYRIKKEAKKKIIFISQEPFKPDSIKSENKYFFQKKWKYGPNNFLFVPDAVLSPGTIIHKWWGKYTTTRSYLTGYPRFDYYCDKHSRPTRKEVLIKYGLSADKKIVFFPSYPPYIYVDPLDGMNPNNYKKSGYILDLLKERDSTIDMLEKFVKENSNYQVIIKIHPMSHKIFKQNNLEKCKAVNGKLLEYYKNPTENIKVIGDKTDDGTIAKDLVSVADIVVGWGSTMLLEAMLLRKPVVHILIGENEVVNFYQDYDERFPVARDYETFCAAIKNELVVHDESLIEKYFYKNDGETCKRICEAINKEMSNKIPAGKAGFKLDMIPKSIRT